MNRERVLTLVSYSEQCDRDTPNPRILERKGALIKFVFQSENISNSVNSILLKELEQFVEIHDELMRGIFQRSLSELNIVKADGVDDSVIDIASDTLTTAVDEVEKYTSETVKGGARIDIDAYAIISDVYKDVNDLTASYERSNDAGTKALRLARLKVAVLHGALFIGRLILRSIGTSLEYGSHAATIAAFVEAASPGSIRAAYEILRTKIPDLPPLP